MSQFQFKPMTDRNTNKICVRNFTDHTTSKDKDFFLNSDKFVACTQHNGAKSVVGFIQHNKAPSSNLFCGDHRSDSHIDIYCI